MTENGMGRIFESVTAGLRRESDRRLNIAKKANNSNYSFALEDERELGTASAIANCLTEASYFSRLDWYYYGKDNRPRPDLTVWLPQAQHLIFFELKRVGQGWPYSGLLQDMEKLCRLGKKCVKNKANGLIVVQFSKQEDSQDRLKGKLDALRGKYSDYAIWGPKLFQQPESDIPEQSFGYIGLVYNRALLQLLDA